MCSRWGADIGRVDRELYANLQALVGPYLSFMCTYVGTAARFIAIVAPAPVIGKLPKWKTTKTSSQQLLLEIHMNSEFIQGMSQITDFFFTPYVASRWTIRFRCFIPHETFKSYNSVIFNWFYISKHPTEILAYLLSTGISILKLCKMLRGCSSDLWQVEASIIT